MEDHTGVKKRCVSERGSRGNKLDRVRREQDVNIPLAILDADPEALEVFQ